MKLSAVLFFPLTAQEFQNEYMIKCYRFQLKDLLMVFISGLELSDRNTRCLPSAQLAVDWIVGEAGEMDDQVDKNKMVVAKN